jgi:hypothetical protein
LMLAAAGWANAATTKVITVAGGYAGNGKPATAAGIDQLSSVAVDTNEISSLPTAVIARFAKLIPRELSSSSPALRYVDTAGTADRPPPR